MKARLTLKVRPGAAKTEFRGMHGEAWKMLVAAPPADGRANDAILRFLAETAGVRKSSVRIVSGLTSTTKIVEIDGIDSAALTRAILESHGSHPYTGRTAPRET